MTKGKGRTGTVDECPHTFEKLALNVLPAYMTQLRKALKAPHKSSEFSGGGIGAKSIAKRLGRTADFSGCYVLVDKGQPLYVGISRRVLSRIRQHVTGRSHFDASLTFAVAKRRLPIDGSRSQAMENKEFRKAFDKAQDYLRSLDVTFIEITNSLELYLFEAFAPIELRTGEWNTFRTH